jgi:ABC-type Mn2+/Zn2+ transport system permease subunit
MNEDELGIGVIAFIAAVIAALMFEAVRGNKERAEEMFTNLLALIPVFAFALAVAAVLAYQSFVEHR